MKFYSDILQNIKAADYAIEHIIRNAFLQNISSNFIFNYIRKMGEDSILQTKYQKQKIELENLLDSLK